MHSPAHAPRNWLKALWGSLKPRIELPVVAAEPAPLRARLLVVDDDRCLLLAMGRLLRNHDTTLCSSIGEAIAAYSTKEFDLVLCDMMMPNENGMAMYEALEARGPEHVGRLVFMSGGAFTEATQRFFATHAVPCMDKPVPYAALTTLIGERLAAASRVAA